MIRMMLWTLLIPALAAGWGCGGKSSRSYEEKPVSATTATPTAGAPAPGPVAPTHPLIWKVPAGWTEQPATGMRLASFTCGEKPNTGLCTIIALTGQAGGLKPNVQRWMQQIGLTPPAESELDRFLARQERIPTAGGWTAILIDLTELQKDGAGDTPAIIAALVPVGESTLFLKMTGSRTVLRQHRDGLQELCRSLRGG
jgi:hypothetical protein